MKLKIKKISINFPDETSFQIYSIIILISQYFYIFFNKKIEEAK